MEALVIIPKEALELLQKDIQQIKERLFGNGKGGLDDLITEDQLRKIMGNVHPSTIWRQEKRGRLTPIRIGNSKMYRLSDIAGSPETTKKKMIK